MTELYRHTPAPHVLELPVLGLPVQFATNSPEVADIMEQAFGAWRAVDASFDDPVRVRILLHEGDEHGAEHAPLSYRMPDDHRVLIHSPGSIALTDPARREAVAYVTAALAADHAHFRYGVLESMTFALLTRMDRQPFHAAAVMHDGAVLLLCGESGSGKSTLTYAAARAGHAVLADDVVFLQSQPRLRVWGMPGFIHLPEEARTQFPELRTVHAMLQANGKHKLAVAAAEVGTIAALPYADRCGICIIGARRRTATARPISAEEALQLIRLDSESGFDQFATSIRPVVRQLAANGGWLLHPSMAPDESLPLLQEMLGSIAEVEEIA